MVVLLVVAAKSLYLERKRLSTLADGAAVVGAEVFEPQTVAPEDGGLRTVPTDSEVRAAVADCMRGPDRPGR